MEAVVVKTESRPPEDGKDGATAFRHVPRPNPSLEGPVGRERNSSPDSRRTTGLPTPRTRGAVAITVGRSTPAARAAGPLTVAGPCRILTGFRNAPSATFLNVEGKLARSAPERQRAARPRRARDSAHARPGPESPHRTFSPKRRPRFRGHRLRRHPLRHPHGRHRRRGARDSPSRSTGCTRARTGWSPSVRPSSG